MNDLEKALNTIREECKKHERCSLCPLRSHVNKCVIQTGNPDEWKFKNDEDMKDVPARIFV